MGGADAPGRRAGHRRGRKKKLRPHGILELLGIALGRIRLSYDDFLRLDFEEFAAVYRAYAEQRDADFRDDWQRMRLLAAIVIQPHLDRRHRVTPERLLPFPWDRERAAERRKTGLTPEQQRRRMEDLARRFGDSMI